jgi:hypothetical protein
MDPSQTDQGEKLLGVPKTLAQMIEMNVEKNHCLLEITRHGLGTNTKIYGNRGLNIPYFLLLF